MADRQAIVIDVILAAGLIVLEIVAIKKFKKRSAEVVKAASNAEKE